MLIALVGTRGAGSYGGFETCVAEVGARLADRGHDVRVYARRWSDARRWRHPGATVVTLPSIPTKNLDTVTHSAVCTTHALLRRPDTAIVFGVGNSPWAAVLRRAGVHVVLNVDGLDRERDKWGGPARRYLEWAERVSARAADVVVTDAGGVTDYYRDRYGVEGEYIAYGSPDGPVESSTALDRFGLEPGGYVLYVSRLEPENHPEVAIEAHARSGIGLPLVVVGGSAYDDDYEQHVRALPRSDVRFTGFVFGDAYAELQSHAAVYVQCTAVGGTHPALVEAMGYRNCVVALDNDAHREVLADTGRYYDTTDELATHLRDLTNDPDRRRALAAATHARSQARYSWDTVTDSYERLCRSGGDGP